MTFRELYLSKVCGLDEALNLIQSEDQICMACDGNEPTVFAANLHEIATRVDNVQVIKSRTGDYPFLTMPEMSGHIHTSGFFFGSGWIKGVTQSHVQLLVSDLQEYARSLVNNHTCNVLVASVPPMDTHGKFHISLSMLWEKEIFEDIITRPNHKIIFEVNSRQPQLDGGILVDIAMVDAVYEVDVPLPVLNEPLNPLSADGLYGDDAVSDRIAANIASLIHDGDCMQLGVGPLSDKVTSLLLDRNDLGIHTVMMTDAMLKLIEAGVATGKQKNVDFGQHVFSFAGGDADFYDRIQRVRNLSIRPASYVSDPMVISRMHNMVAINTLVEMDLTGQVCAESIGPKQLSGAGASCDFALGAIHAPGGRSILAFPTRSASGVSKIQGMLHDGAAVSIPRNYVDYIVTEYGIAEMRGQSVWERAQQLVQIAHPDDREMLTEYAHQNKYF